MIETLMDIVFWTMMGLLGIGVVAFILYKLFVVYATWDMRRFLRVGDPALRELVTRLREQFAETDPPIEELDANWQYGYPCVLVLFANKELELRAKQAGSSGLAHQIRSAVASLVSQEERFRKQRVPFDVQQGTWFLHDREFYESLLQDRRDRLAELGLPEETADGPTTASTPLQPD